MDIPWQHLSADTLDGLVEEFVSREGTEYGAREYTLEEKVEQVKRQLKDGRARIVYDPEAQTCHIVSNEA